MINEIDKKIDSLESSEKSRLHDRFSNNRI